ncbi:hypothetical protein [Cellulomonas marina]|uniref:CopG-like RHH_1 or ribbon-helix-helix domain-containing protein, RHH_5 n=1 Tax=Cellulomonas marina TaxID=988821 RepID=A0A1I0Y7F2_9CELL|nr:hypothetical protein [Cellulomonas marina]GIG29786.1 hypothetical protein Cma02nite_23860 [Cellulomonas marina]SFB08073.1 CopG-like RHH_1 or ribbon-helix-helix domain-containing protein, RHH_5 [Cellulomonas marina]
MRTTFHLPDDLYRDVKRVAVEDGRTMTSFVEQALRDALARHRAPSSERERYVVTPLGGQGLHAGVDLADSAALLERMDGRA